MITALLFDFDGLLLDTETPSYDSWREIYQEYGFDLPMELWQGALGTNHGFQAHTHLASLVDAPFDLDTIMKRRDQRKWELATSQPLLPGVIELLEAAQSLGIPCAVASSSNHTWIAGWLEFHKIGHYFQCVRTGDMVEHTKPWPDLFLSAADGLGVSPNQCLVFEDSPNGILAAKAAGMRCVLVPGAVTRQLQLPEADRRLESLLEALPLEAFLASFA
jgi:HAD superfamily hydrolase (TIGR01509 family)